MTEGNQKWRGAAPTFRNRDRIIINGGKEYVIYRSRDAVSRSVEPRAWVRKYFKVASLDKMLSLLASIMGTKDIRFSSRPNQAVIQFGAEAARREPASNVVIKRETMGRTVNMKRKTLNL